MRSDWFETFFHGVALDLWRKAVPPEYTRAEVDFLIEELNGPEGASFLDIPCGNGRHALELARRGFRMTGMDISEQFIEEARAVSAKESLTVEWILVDMRRLQEKEVFDGAFCFGNSFGYLEHDDNVEFLRNLHAAIKPSGRLVLNAPMAAEALLPTLKERDWYQIEDILMAIEHRYDAETSCIENHYTFVQGGKQETRVSFHWVYTAGEIGRMLSQVGFRVLKMFGDLQRNPFKLGSSNLLITAERT